MYKELLVIALTLFAPIKGYAQGSTIQDAIFDGCYDSSRAISSIAVSISNAARNIMAMPEGDTKKESGIWLLGEVGKLRAVTLGNREKLRDELRDKYPERRRHIDIYFRTYQVNVEMGLAQALNGLAVSEYDFKVKLEKECIRDMAK
jgi:hypothetical protein